MTTAEVRIIFRVENAGKGHDSFPENILDRAEKLVMLWEESTLAELGEIMLPWNKEFGIPEQGMTVTEALRLPKVREKQFPAYAENTHVLLSDHPITSSKEAYDEYGKMRGFEGRLVHIDGLHRLLAAAKIGKRLRAFIAHRNV